MWLSQVDAMSSAIEGAAVMLYGVSLVYKGEWVCQALSISMGPSAALPIDGQKKSPADALHIRMWLAGWLTMCAAVRGVT